MLIRTDHSREAKIAELDDSFACEKYVLRLDVPVNAVVPVAVRHPLQRLPDYLL